MIHEQNSTSPRGVHDDILLVVDKAISKFREKHLETSKIVEDLLSAKEGQISNDLRAKYKAIDPRFLRPSQKKQIQRLFAESASVTDKTIQAIFESDEEKLKQQISIVESEEYTPDEKYDAAYKCLGLWEEVRVPHETLECYKVILLSKKEPLEGLYLDAIERLIGGSCRNKCIIF